MHTAVSLEKPLSTVRKIKERRRMGRKPVSFADLLTPPKLRWPTPGDTLFAPAATPDTQGEIHPDPFSRFVFMMDGYKQAADLLVSEALADQIARHDLIYPIVYCYRQFLELALKWQISTYGPTCGIRNPRHGHGLAKLLTNFKTMCKCYGATDDQALDVVSQCVLEFDRMDPHSFTFRYATGKSGAPYPAIADKIDLERLKDVMEGLRGFFAGCDGYFDDIQGARPSY